VSICGFFNPNRGVVPKLTDEANGYDLRHVTPKTLQKALYVGFFGGGQLSWCDQKETFVCGQKGTGLCGQKENNEVGRGLEIASGSKGFELKVLQRRIGLCGDAT